MAAKFALSRSKIHGKSSHQKTLDSLISICSLDATRLSRLQPFFSGKQA
jgi:hypothetical protein